MGFDKCFDVTFDIDIDETYRQTATVCLSSLSVDEILERNAATKRSAKKRWSQQQIAEDETTTDEMSELTFSYTERLYALYL